MPPRLDFSRWENGGQPQHVEGRFAIHNILADGRTGANRNVARHHPRVGEF